MEKLTKLKELGELLKDKVITQNEFNKLKEEVINDSSNKDSDTKIPRLPELDGIEIQEETQEERDAFCREMEDQIDNDTVPEKITTGSKIFNGVCSFLSLFVHEKTQEEQMAESAYRMSYDPWMKRAFKNFKDA